MIVYGRRHSVADGLPIDRFGDIFFVVALRCDLKQ
jgi:hypothetical protein